MSPIIVIMGPPGAGKGTQGDFLVDRYKFKKLSTGDILREEVESKTEIGVIASQYMKQGELVPDDVMVSIVERRLDPAFSWILDGFPRTVNQAEELDSVLSERGLSIDSVVFIDVQDDEIIRRLTARRTCTHCGALYNLITQAPQREGICDFCGGELCTREDDTEKTVRRRIEVYRNSTAPLLSYYKKRGVLFKIDGMKSPEEVSKDILSILENIGVLDRR